MYVCIFFIVSLVSIGFNQTINAADIFFEHSTLYHPSRGVEYEHLTQMTSIGLRDIHILRIPLNDPYIDVTPVASQQSVGRRESASALLSAAGAVAGINADFFHMTSNYAVHLGPVISGGELVAAQTETNRYSNSLGTFLLDYNNNPFFRYIRFDIYVFVNGIRSIRVNYFNNIGNTLDEPVVFTHQAMRDTSALDVRFPFTAKAVSDGSSITYISYPGETVEIPEGGFIIVFPENMAHRRFHYAVGDSVLLYIRNSLNIDLSAIQTGISGAGMILTEGETANDGGYITTGRQPRSAVGVCRDGRTLILMTVDGRGISVGATHTELAELMRRAGAYNAMHFDGGGSATMVIREDDRYNVVNTPSEGTQRRVVNALGIFDNAVPGEMTGIALEMAQQRVAVNTPVASRVYARDALGLRFPMPEDVPLAYMVLDRDMGTWQDGYYTPLVAGEHTVHVWYNHMWATQTLYVVEIAELQTSPLSLANGERRRLRFTGTGTDGSTLTDVNVTDFIVVPATMGRVEDGYFHATGQGVGYIRAWVGHTVTYIPVSVGRVSAAIDMRLNTPHFSSYPAAFVQGGVRFDQIGAHLIPRLDYNVVHSPETQAAHMVFDPPIVIPALPGEKITALRMQVHGDGSGHWLRARVTDGNGTSHNINFTQNADFIGWETLTVLLPAGAPGPFTLERIWMAALGAEEDAVHSVYFYNLQALYEPPPLQEVPLGTRFADPLRTHGVFTGVPGGGSHTFDVTFVTQTYRFRHEDDMAIIRLLANASGLTERRQWEYMMRDVRASDPYHIVILLNTNPFAFPPIVFELFHNMMRTFADEGRTVFVVSTSAGSAQGSLTLRDGVRYIDGADEIHFFTDGRQIWWYGG